MARKRDQGKEIRRLRIAARLLELRTEAGKTQEQAGRALGIGQSAYDEMEKGATICRRRDLVTLAVFYGLTPEEAFPGLVEAA